MNLVVVHYHFNRSGVAQVVMNHLMALDSLPGDHAVEQVVLCYSGRRDGWPENFESRLTHLRLSECIVPELDYDNESSRSLTPNKLARKVCDSLREQGCDASNSLLHFHNHALGKNTSLPGAVCEFAKCGFRILLQIHDFAEDFRADNYRRLTEASSQHAAERLPDFLYPQGNQIHYAVLNRRDYAVLSQAGVSESQLHLLPNPVQSPEIKADRSLARSKLAKRFAIESDVRYILYPVRGIRRKNLGEVLLWAAMARSNAIIGVTLAPLNPLERTSYARWQALSKKLQLPCVFEVGGETGLSLAENFAASDGVVTTSLAEGFGLAFLESCLVSRPLMGRDLPEVTSDFVREGLRFSGLHSRLNLPAEWLGYHKLVAMFMQKFNAALEAFGRPTLSRLAIEQEFDRMLDNELIDFGCLDAAFQEEIIECVVDDRDRFEKVLEINPWLDDTAFSNGAPCVGEVAQNASLVRKKYSLQSIGIRLSFTYQAVMSSPSQSTIETLSSGERIVDSFLEFSRFRPALL